MESNRKLTIDDARPTAEFFHFVKDAQSLYTWIAYGVIAAPVITYFLGIASPYPNQGVMNISASISAFFALMFAFQLWFRNRASKKRRDNLLWRFGLSGVLILVVYVGAYSMFVVADPAQGSREVVGFTLREDVAIVRDSQSPPMTDRELLENFRGEPEKIWTKSSLAVTRMTMVFAWITMWFLLTGTLGVFLCDSWLKRKAE